jgi:TPR repeat protein
MVFPMRKSKLLFSILSFSALLLSPQALSQVQITTNDPLMRRADELYLQRDYAAAISIYRKAAEAGQPHAMAHLGLCYDRGFGVKADHKEAVRWYRKAADASDIEGMAFLGGMYQDGVGVPVDHKQALIWFHKSANAGGAVGMNKLGLAYENGIGVPKDPVAALQWYMKAANLGDMYGMNNVANMYLGKPGIPKNEAEALKWYRKAAELGEPDSMNQLATSYEHARDLKQAEFWYRKSAALGSENGRQSLMRLGGWQNFDLNGDWEGYFTTMALPEAIQVVQHQDALDAVRLREDLSPLGIAFLRASYEPDKRESHVELAGVGLLSLIQAFNSPKSTGPKGISDAWSPAKITIADPDHFAVNEKGMFQRLTTPRPNDVPCSPQNPLHVKPTFAYIRGKMAVDATNYELGVCWFQIGINFRDGHSASGLADMMRKGQGGPKNPSKAFPWFERAAQVGDVYGAESIANMYDHGELPMDAAKSQLWHAKAKAMREKLEKAKADEIRKEEADRATMHLIGGIALVGGQLLTWDVGADPECDTRARDRTGSGIPNTVDPARQAKRDRMLSNGQMYCGKPIDISPLFPQ